MALQEQTFNQLFLGQLSLEEWKYQFFLISLGILLRIFRSVSKRENKDNKLSISYWFKDVRNYARLFYSLILMYILIRFFGEYEKSLKEFIPSNFEPSVYLIMIALGFFFHKISSFLDSKISK